MLANEELSNLPSDRTPSAPFNLVVVVWSSSKNTYQTTKNRAVSEKPGTAPGPCGDVISLSQIWEYFRSSKKELESVSRISQVCVDLPSSTSFFIQEKQEENK